MNPILFQGGASASAWKDSVHVLQELLLMQQQAQQIYQSQAEQVFSHAYSMSAHDHHRSSGNTEGAAATSYGHMKATSFPGESELLTLLQLPRSNSFVNFNAANRAKGPLYSTSTIAGPLNTGGFFESRLGLSHGGLHHPIMGASQTAANFNSLLIAQNAGSNILTSRQAPSLFDLDQDTGDADAKLASSSPFALKRGEHNIGVLGKVGEPRGVNHFATERQRVHAHASLCLAQR